MEQNNKYTDFLVRHWFPLSLAVVILIGIFFVAQYSFIEIKAASYQGTTGEYTYQIKDASGAKTSEKKSLNPSFKKLVRRGSHQVFVVQGETSYWQLVKSGFFFSTKKVDASLAPEKQRSFVGYNPDPCMEFVNSTLLSFSCNSTLDGVKVHKPATATEPTTVVKANRGEKDEIEGTFTDDDKTFVMLKTISIDSTTAPRQVSTLNSKGEVNGDGGFLKGLTEEGDYDIQKYGDGFIVYTPKLSQILYFKSPTAQPEQLTIQRPKGKNIEMYALSALGNTIAAAFTDASAQERVDVHDSEDAGGSTEIIIFENNKQRSFKVGGYVTSISLCGRQKLCLVTDKQLDVYDLSGKPKKLFGFGGVEGIHTLPNGHLLVADNSKLLDLDVDTQNGHAAYSFGPYSYCGAKGTSNGFILCAIDNNKHTKVGLLFSQNSNTDSIDKRIASLEKSTPVSSVSIHGSYVYIRPNYGPLEANSQGQYDYNIATVTRMNALLEETITQLGINRNNYKIIVKGF